MCFTVIVMLYPRMQTVSQKGQMVIPADFRAAFDVRAGTLVLITPDLVREQIIIKPIKAKDPIAAGYGMFAGEKSLTKALLKQRKKDILLEDKKYV